MSSAKAILKNKELLITSAYISFEEYFTTLMNQSYNNIIDEISVIVVDIQRLIVYPQFGWQIENNVPDKILKEYEYLKNLGFDKYILSKEKIRELINKNGLMNNHKENYFN